MNKIFLTLLIGLFLLTTTVSAEESFMFQKDVLSTIDVSMANNDLSECTSCTCEVSIFDTDGNAVVRNAAGTNVDGYCQYNMTFDKLGIYGGEITATNGVDYGRSTFGIIVTYTGQKVSLSNSMIIFALLGLGAIFLTISFFFKPEYWMLKSFFQFMAVLAGLIAVNSARIIASESNSIGTMGEMGLLLIIVVLGFFFLWIFIKAFLEIIAIFKRRGDLRWNYD